MLGGNVGCKLLSSNTHLYERQIPLEDLTKPFLEAIQFTHDLGFSYLWINAPCIVQDSEQDWDAECKKMGDIYAGGLLNMAATSSSDGDRGLFSNWHTGKLPTFTLRFRDEVLQQEATFWPYNKDHFFVEPLHFSPLGGRGCVLQERLLSPITTHFVAEQILWECYCRSDAETLPLDLSRQLRASE